MKGTIADFFAIIVGGLIGMKLKGKLAKNIHQTIIQGISLAIILIGLQMALKTEHILVLIISIVLGGIVGELLGIESIFNSLGVYSVKFSFLCWFYGYNGCNSRGIK